MYTCIHSREMKVKSGFCAKWNPESGDQFCFSSSGGSAGFSGVLF